MVRSRQSQAFVKAATSTFAPGPSRRYPRAMEPRSAFDAARTLAPPGRVCEDALASLAVGVVVEDAVGRVLACNASAERVLGLTRGQLMGTEPVDPAWSTIHEDGWPLPAEARPGAVALAGGVPCTDAT